ncbi:MAG: hypothetical protein J5725_08780 [Bacteroidales bacterium]|nr:hypothetical protein [Bacteroidales bacterium]
MTNERPPDEVIIAHERIAYERGVADGYAEALEEMKDKERPQGEWLDRNSGCIQWIRCSICNKHQDYRAKTNFCPNCGADMRGTRK